MILEVRCPALIPAPVCAGCTHAGAARSHTMPQVKATSSPKNSTSSAGTWAWAALEDFASLSRRSTRGSGSCCLCRSRLRPGCRSSLGNHWSRSCCCGCRSVPSLRSMCMLVACCCSCHDVYAGRIGLLSALSHTRSARPRLCRGGWVQIPCVAPRGHVVPTRVRRYAAAARPRTRDRYARVHC